MKKHLLYIVFFAAGFTGCKNTTNEGTETPKADSAPAAAPAVQAEAPPPPLDSLGKAKVAEAELAKWKNYMTPGDTHKMIASWAGNWTEEVTVWMDENIPLEKTTGAGVYKVIMGGLYLQCTHKGTMMKMPFEAMRTLGYDNARKLFISSWVDNMGSGIMYGEGPYDSTARTITLKGKVMDCLLNKEKDFTEVIKIIDDKHQVLELYQANAKGKTFKNIEIKYTKK